MRNILCNVSRLSDESSVKIGEEFLKHEKVIESLVKYHQYRYGGDYESLYAVAIDKLLYAYVHYDSSRSEWEKYWRCQIYYGLRDNFAYNCKKKYKVNTNVDDFFLEVPTQACDDYDVKELEESLTPDAVYVLKFMLNCDSVELNTPTKRERAVKAKTRSMGWSRRRTETALLEIKCIVMSES
jgi:hypothetical protein